MLFDWNGTIVLDADRARESLNDVLASHALPVLDNSGFEREFHLPMASMFSRLGVPTTASAEADWNRGMIARGTTARRGTAALRRLRQRGDVRLGIVSAASAASVEADIAALHLDGIWHTLDAPSVDKVETLRSRRNSAAHTYYVGDTAYDMRCAVDAGYTPIAVTGGYTRIDVLRHAGAEYVIDTLDELTDIFEKAEGLSHGPRLGG